MLWDGDISFPVTAKAGCCLNVSFPVAILISEIKNLKYNMLNLEKEGSGMFEVFTIIPIFLPDLTFLPGFLAGSGIRHTKSFTPTNR